MQGPILINFSSQCHKTTICHEVPIQIYSILKKEKQKILHGNLFSLTFTAESVCLCGVSSPVVVFGLFVRFS